MGGVRIRPSAASGGGGNITYDSDVNDTNVSLLLHGEGSNGSTTITDNSHVTKTLTTHGNAQVSTAQHKYGGSSISFDGSTSTYVDAAQSNDFAFGTGDFTMEAWIWLNSWGSGYPYPGYSAWMFDTRNPSNPGSEGVGFGMSETGHLNAFWGSNLRFSCPTVLPLSTWLHVALVRRNSTGYIYLNGVLEDSMSFTQNLTTNYLFIGSPGDQTGNSYIKFDGYMDEVRVTKGHARYTGTFTPPVSAFPSYASIETSYPSPKVGDSVVSYNKIYLCTATGPSTWISGSIL